MLRTLPGLLLLACQPVYEPLTQAQPAAQAPPPAGVTLRVPTLVRGYPGRASLVHPQLAGRAVRLAASYTGVGAGPCPPALGGACLDVLQPAVLAQASGDPTGRVAFAFTTPWYTVDAIWVQAVVPDALPGGRAWVSEPVRVEVVWASHDSDRDDLYNGDEALFGTDPGVLDSDGGGISDAQEVLYDFTDPLVPGDDLPGERLCDLGRADDDLDGRRDCNDPDCAVTPACRELACDDGVDNNRNGLRDCLDVSCWHEAACTEASCADGFDDDFDALIDCADPDCAGPTCSGETLAWVMPQKLFLRHEAEEYAVFDTGDTDGSSIVVEHTYEVASTSLQLGAWVANSTDGGPRICLARNGFSGRGSHEVDRGCENAVLPELRLSWDPSTLTIQHNGQAILTFPADLGPNLSTDPDYESFAVEVTDLAPVGTCVGSPTRVFLDRDGDGYGVSEPTDMYGLLHGPAWVCAPTAGTSAVGGDCDDGDPALHPGTLTLAPGATCVQTWTDDRDADGVPAALDTNDLDGSVP